MVKDYNTARSPILLKEYGRNVQNLIGYIKTLESKEERSKSHHGRKEKKRGESERGRAVRTSARDKQGAPFATRSVDDDRPLAAPIVVHLLLLFSATFIHQVPLHYT